jgi:hypothetical protein
VLDKFLRGLAGMTTAFLDEQKIATLEQVTCRAFRTARDHEPVEAFVKDARSAGHCGRKRAAVGDVTMTYHAWAGVDALVLPR